MELIEPSSDFKDSFIEAVKEFQRSDDYTHRTKAYQKLSIPELETDFESFIVRERSHMNGENLPEGHVPQTDYWLVDNGFFVGRASIRHKLVGRLERIGGHIGFDIRPSMRGKGYGTHILELALLKAKDLGIDRILLTCDIRNDASRKVIEKNGGVFESQIPNDEKGFEGFDALRFWVDTSGI